MRRYKQTQANRSIRALIVAGAAFVGAVALWLCRPASVPASDATGDVARVCAWLVWAVLAYVAVAVTVVAAAHVGGSAGRVAAVAARLAPAAVRHAVELALGAGLAATVATATPALAADGAPAPQPSVTAPALEWPGLASSPTAPTQASSSTPAPTTGAVTAPEPPAVSSGGGDDRAPLLAPPAVAPPSAAPAPTSPPSTPPPPPAAALVTAPAHRAAAAAEPDVVVRAGDSLWSVAARHLGPGAGDAEIAAAWPRWYAANRTVIGSDPNLIHPGQRLVPPAPVSRSTP